MACHAALTKAHAKGCEPAPEQLEKALDGNLCRCTGYRPILSACKVLLQPVPSSLSSPRNHFQPRSRCAASCL